MISIGATAKRLRDAFGLTQRVAAERLGISNVHLCNVEKNKSTPSTSLLEAYRREFGVDLYVLAWCEQGDAESLPPSVRSAARQLHKAWSREVEKLGVK